MTRTFVPSVADHLVLIAIERRGPSLVSLALALGFTETELRGQLRDLMDAEFVEEPTSFYPDSRVVDGPAIYLTTRGEAIAAEPPPWEEVEAIKQPLLRKYPNSSDVVGVSDDELQVDHRTALLLMVTLPDAGPIGTVGSWLGQERRRRLDGLIGVAAVQREGSS